MAAGLTALALAWSQEAVAANCPAALADIDRQLSAALKTYNESSSALFACYNNKIQSELSSAGKRFRDQTNGVSKSQRAALQASHAANRRKILEQWQAFRVEKAALMTTYKANTAALSAARRKAASGQCSDPWGASPDAATAARQQQINDVKAKIAGHDRVLKDHSGRRDRDLAQLQDIKGRMR